MRLCVAMGPHSYDIDVPVKYLSSTIGLGGLLLLCACSEEPPPISVTEFMENPRLLEATMVRCSQNRAEMKYVADCINARDAVNRLEAAQERARKEELERLSERKRKALRRTQEAAAAARRRAEEERRRREEEQYLGLFEDPPDGAAQTESPQEVPSPGTELPVSNAPTVDLDPPEDPGEAPLTEIGTDLGAIREELKRRQEDPQN